MRLLNLTYALARSQATGCSALNIDIYLSVWQSHSSNHFSFPRYESLSILYDVMLTKLAVSLKEKVDAPSSSILISPQHSQRGKKALLRAERETLKSRSSLRLQRLSAPARGSSYFFLKVNISIGQ